MDKSEVVSSVIEILTPVLVAGLTFLSAWLAKLITAKVKGEYLRGVLVRLDESVFTAVKSVAQTYADALKSAREDGKLDPAERQEAKRRALSALKSYLGAKGIGELGKILGLTSDAQVEEFLAGKVEAAVHDLNLVKRSTERDEVPPLGVVPAGA
ncbi:MAG: hypothetical protein AB1405_18490 [Bdellovibrionota bacterium]